MTEPTTEEAPPRPKSSRTIGIVYLLYFLMAIFATLPTRGMVVLNDAAALAANFSAHASAFRVSFAMGLLANALYVTLTILFYELFRPVNRTLSLLAAAFSFMGCAVQVFGCLLQLAPGVILGGAGQAVQAFKAEELQGLALLFFRLYAQSFQIAFVFFAFYDLLLGYLVFRSGFLPRFFGVLLMLAGVGWLSYLWPPWAVPLSPYVQPLGFLGEVGLMIWLLIRGVRAHPPDGRF